MLNFFIGDLLWASQQQLVEGVYFEIISYLLTWCWLDFINESVFVNPLFYLFSLAQPGTFPKIKNLSTVAKF